MEAGVGVRQSWSEMHALIAKDFQAVLATLSIYLELQLSGQLVD